MNGRHMDLVVCSLEPWDSHWRRNQFLIAGLLRSNPHLRVLFVEPPEDPMYLMRLGMKPAFGKGLRMQTGVPGIGSDRLWSLQPTKWLPRAVHGAADRRLAGITMKVTRTLGFRTPILWINNPTAAAVMDRTGWPTVYDMTDDWLLADRGGREASMLAAAEGNLMDRADEVTVCSDGLARTKGRIRPVTLIPNAVDVVRYRTPYPRPPDLPAGKVALYVGTAHPDRVDGELAVRTARYLTRQAVGRMVLVGSFQMPPEVREGLESAGTVILGQRPNTEVPAYLQHAEILIVPHVVTPFTDSLDPIKLYEYLAVGRPILSTPVAGFRDTNSPGVTIADAAAFPQVLGRELAIADARRGAAYIATDLPDWSARVREMEYVLAKLAHVAAGRR